MRGFIVLAGMGVAAGAAVLIWLDATGQLRSWLSTTPEIVFQLDPAPTAAAAPVASPAIVSAADSDSSDSSDEAIEPTGAGTGADADIEEEEPGATETVGEAAPAALPETELAADFGEGAVALSDVPIASGDDGAAADGDATAVDETGASEPAEATSGEPTAGADSAEAGMVATEEEPAADAAETDPVAEPAADVAPPEEKPETAGTEPEAADPDELQTAALPILSRDPNLPWRRYAAPFADGEPRPRIAIVFVQLGLSDGATEAIIQQLPGAVTLAFSPYSRKLPDWIARARAKGHEVLVELPMEPLNYPDEDPGPLALLDERPIEDNVTRLEGILDRAEGAVGVAAQMGSRFTGDEALIGPILQALGERGFLYVDNATAPINVVPALSQRIAVPIVVNDHYLDTEASRIAIDGRLQQIERLARSEGAAVAFAMPYPITIERLLAWIPTLEAKGFVLTPVTAVVGHQELP